MIDDKITLNDIPEPRESSKQLLEATEIRLPKAIRLKSINVATLVKRQNRRKTH